MNKKHLKHLVTMVMMLVISFNLSSCTDVYDENLVLDVSTPYSVADCKGKDKEAVRDDFVLAGFSNVFEETINDLDITESNMYGTVESVSINGVTNFEGNEEFKSLSRVVIKYHSYKLTSVPFSYEEVEDIENETIIEAFRDAGFVTITSDEVYDIDPDIGDKEFINNVSIDGITYFEKDEQFPANAEVKIVVHRPYKKHTLKVLVDFVPNLIFNIYDVYF